MNKNILLIYENYECPLKILILANRKKSLTYMKIRAVHARVTIKLEKGGEFLG